MTRSPRLLTTLAILLACFPGSGLAQALPLAPAGPPPMEVGKTYEVAVMGDFTPGEVLEMTDGPWIRFRFPDEGELWVNSMFIFAFREVDPQVAAERVNPRRQRAYEAAMKSDLRNLQSAQEIHYGNGNYRYSTSLEELEFTPSQGVTIEIGSEDLERGFWAVASHEATDMVCAVYVNEDNRREPATESGYVQCTDGSER